MIPKRWLASESPTYNSPSSAILCSQSLGLLDIAVLYISTLAALGSPVLAVSYSLAFGWQELTDCTCNLSGLPGLGSKSDLSGLLSLGLKSDLSGLLSLGLKSDLSGYPGLGPAV